MDRDKLLVSVVGPTAIGKTAICIELARHFKTGIISADSRQFYREMTIGTAKPTEAELASATFYFVNSLSVAKDYTVADFEKAALETAGEIFKQHDILFTCGGSGLFLHALWNGFDEDIPGQDVKLREELMSGYQKDGLPYLVDKLQSIDSEALNNIDLKNHVRLIRAIEIITQTGKSLSELKTKKIQNRPFRQLKIGLQNDRLELYERINQRVDEMMENGLLSEVESLLAYRHKNALRCIGYQELFRYFDGELKLEEAVDLIKTNSRHYAKRQMTWFRRYDDIHWFQSGDIEGISEFIKENQLQKI